MAWRSLPEFRQARGDDGLPDAAGFLVRHVHGDTRGDLREFLFEQLPRFPDHDIATRAGNHHRLITAIHYDTGKKSILQILTHAEYSKNHWKKSL